ncbi:MAG: transcription termination factor Rho [Desulfobacterales bacterium]|nr:transcription termination factor Rho [Desulfobacterales bacterium]
MGAKEKKAKKEKPLEKLTAIELRAEAMKIPDVAGAHGMNKAELIKVIKEARGIVDDTAKKNTDSIREIKKKIKSLKNKREAVLSENKDNLAMFLKKRISRLKKKTRRTA